MPLKILKSDAEKDLLLLSVEEDQNVDFFSVGNGGVDIGEEVYTIGNPGGYGLSLSRGIVSKTKVIIENGGCIYNVIQLNMDISNGNSGGPVFNKKGQLVGIMAFRLKDSDYNPISGFSYAIPVDEIIGFLEGV